MSFYTYGNKPVFKAFLNKNLITGANTNANFKKNQDLSIPNNLFIKTNYIDKIQKMLRVINIRILNIT